MAIVTLTTDMGNRDYYVASVKGAILSCAPGTRIVDVSHHVSPFDVAEAAFILKNAYKHFPKGTIHIIGVNSEANLKQAHVAVEANGHFFIGADNGIFSLLLDTIPDKIVEIQMQQDTDYHTFPTRDIFAKAAGLIARGSSLEFVGPPIPKLKDILAISPIVYDNYIAGSIIYVDYYGNAFTNITETLFKEVVRGRDFKLIFSTNDNIITKIRARYSDAAEGNKLALFSTSGFLQIAINKGVSGSGGGANQLFALNKGQQIRLEFYDH